MAHSRAHIRLNTSKDVTNFVQAINSDGSVDKYIIENFDGTYVIDARSFLGVMYMTMEHNDEMYLVNLTNNNKYPFIVDKYRI